jgi:DNA-binding response OmpR family regulator
VRVLVVEDEAGIRASLERGLKADGFTVDVAADGANGLWMARERSYDAIVLDILLPETNGYQVCGILREEGNWTPILMLTAKTGEFDEVEALDTGADDFLSKPFSYPVLVARLRALLRRGARERPSALQVDDLRLDPANRTCTRGEQPIALTPREFGLLEFLMRHADEVVSKRELLDQVWDPDFDGSPNIVEVYVGYLRRKIDRPFGRNTIATIPGIGYRLVSAGA